MDEYKHASFSGYGIELEYAIVDSQDLEVLPIADRLLEGAQDMDVPRGDDAAWSNELSLHVIEVKTNGPASDLAVARRTFRREVNALNERLASYGAQLMPTAMHPWMNPLTETRLWPHENNEIYSAFNRVFDCHGHGWSNLQSMHINFPFQNEEEFAALHAAARVVLPLIPAIAASSPFWEGRRAPHLDQRLFVYKSNCSRVPSVTGAVIPEPIFDSASYLRLLESIYADISPFDPEGILKEEWLNARGAIARFDRGAIEIRVIDAQECPEQDLAIAFFITEVVRSLAQEAFSQKNEQRSTSTENLASLFWEAVAMGSRCAVPPSYARLFRASAPTMGGLFTELLARLVDAVCPHQTALTLIAERGNLAERLLAALPEDRPSREPLRNLYRMMCTCLSTGQAFVPQNENDRLSHYV